LDRAIHTALIRLFALEEECFAVPANIRLTGHSLAECRQLEVRRPMIGVLRGTSPSVAIGVDTTTPARSRGEADLRSFPIAVLSPTLFSLCWILRLALDAVLESISREALLALLWFLLIPLDAVTECVIEEPLFALIRFLLLPLDAVLEGVNGESLLALIRFLLLPLDAVLEGVSGEPLFALIRLLLLPLDAVLEGVSGEPLLALIRRLFLALSPLTKTRFSEASLPLLGSLAHSLESLAQGTVRHARLYRTSTGVPGTAQKPYYPLRGGVNCAGCSRFRRTPVSGSSRSRRITRVESRRNRRIILGSRSNLRITPRHLAGAGSRSSLRINRVLGSRSILRINQGVFLGSPTTTVLTGWPWGHQDDSGHRVPDPRLLTSHLLG